MAKIYTRTGDSGETSLFGGRRVKKDDIRIEAIGGIDETNAGIGVVRVELMRSGVSPHGVDELLRTIQHRLFDLGAELASPEKPPVGMRLLDEADIVAIEAAIDRYEAELQPLRVFILPGGAAAAAQLHSVRCVCRRAERRICELATREMIRPMLLQYVNRLSDLLFVLARVANQANRVSDVGWEPKG